MFSSDGWSCTKFKINYLVRNFALYSFKEVIMSILPNWDLLDELCINMGRGEEKNADEKNIKLWGTECVIIATKSWDLFNLMFVKMFAYWQKEIGTYL